MSAPAPASSDFGVRERHYLDWFSAEFMQPFWRTYFEGEHERARAGHITGSLLLVVLDDHGDLRSRYTTASATNQLFNSPDVVFLPFQKLCNHFPWFISQEYTPRSADMDDLCLLVLVVDEAQHAHWFLVAPTPPFTAHAIHPTAPVRSGEEGRHLHHITRFGLSVLRLEQLAGSTPLPRLPD